MALGGLKYKVDWWIGQLQKWCRTGDLELKYFNTKRCLVNYDVFYIYNYEYLFVC